MLRDERQAALNDLLVAIEDAADGHEDAATQCGDAAVAAQLRALAAERAGMAREVEDTVRRLGDLPRQADRDLESARRLITRVVTALSGDERRALLDQRAEAERELLRHVDAALATGMPQDIAATLETFRARIETAIRELEAAAG